MTAKRVLACALIVLAMTGCSSVPAPEAPTSSRAAKGPDTPKPTEAQRQDLASRIGPLAPKEPKDRVIVKARYVCATILRKANESTIVEKAATHFSRPSDAVTKDEATKIVAAVRANGFCK